MQFEKELMKHRKTSTKKIPEFCALLTLISLSPVSSAQQLPKKQPDVVQMAAPNGFPNIHMGMTIKEFIPLRPAAKFFDKKGKAHSAQIKNAAAYANEFFTEQIKGNGFISEVKYIFLDGRLYFAMFSSETNTKPLSTKMEAMVLQGVCKYGVPSEILLQGHSSKAAVLLWRRKNGCIFIRFNTDYYERRASQDWWLVLGDNDFVERQFGKLRTPTVSDEKYILAPMRRALAKAGQKCSIAIPGHLLKATPGSADPKFSVDPKARELFDRAAKNYSDLATLSLTVKTRDLSPEPESTETGLTRAWLQRPDKVRVEFQGDEKRFYMMDGKFMYHGTAIGSGGGYEKIAMRPVSPENPDPSAGYIGIIGDGIGQVLEQLLQGKFIFAERAEAGEDEYLKGSTVEYLPPQQIGKNILEGFRVRSLYGEKHLTLSEVIAWFDTKTHLLTRTHFRDLDPSKPQDLIDEIVDIQLSPPIGAETFLFRPEKGISVREPKPFVFPKP